MKYFVSLFCNIQCDVRAFFFVFLCWLCFFVIFCRILWSSRQFASSFVTLGKSSVTLELLDNPKLRNFWNSEQAGRKILESLLTEVTAQSSFSSFSRPGTRNDPDWLLEPRFQTSSAQGSGTQKRRTDSFLDF